jgi:hypothetical protein
MTVHAREDDIDTDFEWVNTWAAAATARSAPAVVATRAYPERKESEGIPEDGRI